MVPIFLGVGLQLRSIDPDVPVVFGLSPFTTVEELTEALATGGHPLAFGSKGRVVERDGILYLTSEDGTQEFAAVRGSLRAAVNARLAVTIPGTKTIELAALGVPTIVVTPHNVPEAVVITGLLQYIDRVPLIGIPLKRQMVVKFAQRFPNITPKGNQTWMPIRS